VNINERFDRLDSFITEDRLLRNQWGDGEERACLLLAISPEVGAEGFVDRCPASVLPPWLAEITPNLDDCGTEEAWPAMVRRYAVVVRRGAKTLDDAGWRRVLARVMLAVLAGAAPHDPSGSCQRVSGLWSRVLAGDEPGAEEWAEVAAAAWAEVAAAAWAEVAAAAWAEVRRRRRRGARRAAAAAAAWAARGVAEAAARGVAEAAARGVAEAAARGVAEAATWDRITTSLLDGIELECGASREEEGT
jgi:hypothetical protein